MITITIIIIILIIYITRNDKKNNKQNNNNNIPITNTNTISEYKKYYKKKRYITTKSELIFFKELLKICKKYNLIILTQVALYELVEVNLNKYDKEYLKYFNKIKSKTIDFVIIDENTTRIRLCIELDDYTHKYNNRIKRDNFINNLFNELDIDLIRTTNNCNFKELENKIKNICTDNIYTKE